MRVFKMYSWVELIKIRDALQILCDTCLDRSREWVIFDDELADVSNEIDYRYKNDKREG